MCIIIATMLSLCFVGGCARPTPRPIVRENGLVLSELTFPADRDALALPLRPARSLLMTNAVRINGRPVGWMIIDTGAGWTCIDHATAQSLGIGPDKFWKSPEGEKPPSGMYRIDSLELGGGDGGAGGGGMSLRNHVVAVIDLSSLNALHVGVPIAGVVGADVFGAAPFTIDAPRRELILHRRSAFRPPTRGAVEDIVWIGQPRTRGAYFDANPCAGQPVVRARIDEVKAAVLLDTGSGVSLALQPWFTKAHAKFLPADAKAAGTVVGAAGPNGLDGRKLLHARVECVTLLGAGMGSDAGAVALVGDDMHHGTAATVGQPLLRYGRLTFDYAAGRVWAQWQRVPRPSTSPGDVAGIARREACDRDDATRHRGRHARDLTLSPHSR